MNDSDLFDDFVASNGRGRRIDRAGLDSQVATELDRYLGRTRAAITAASQAIPTLPPIYTDFVTNPQFNAFAFKHRDQYLIAFHGGLPQVLLTVLYRLMSDRRVFRQIGEPDQEAESLPLFHLDFPDAAKLAMASPGAVVPTHSWRQIYAIHLSHLAFDFLTVQDCPLGAWACRLPPGRTRHAVRQRVGMDSQYAGRKHGVAGNGVGR